MPWVDSLPLPGYRFSPQLFPQIDQFHTGPPILLLRCPPLPPWSGRPSVPGCTLCLPFQDPLNVGAVLRTAAAFGVLDIVHLKGSAHPFHPKALRAGGSAIFRTHLWRGPSLEGLAGLGDALVTLSPEGVPLEAFRWPETFCLAPGIEGAGLPAELKGARTLGIPMAAGVESLNAAMATGIALYHWRSGSRSGPLAVGR